MHSQVWTQMFEQYKDALRLEAVAYRGTCLQEDRGHRMQGLLRPRLKPINDCVVDQARKVAAAGAQGLANRRHGQDHVQVVAALQHKLGPAGFLAVACPLFHCLHSIVTQVTSSLHTQGSVHMQAGSQGSLVNFRLQ